jgi:NADH:ubiquinone oxidoreductase subunit 6 (subunit J)
MRSTALQAVAVSLLALMFILIFASVDWPDDDMDEISNERLAETLFGTRNESGYALVVVLIGVLLLVALLGGVFLAKEEKE